jgi:hypothetical protein
MYASKHPLGVKQKGAFYTLEYISPIDGKEYKYPKSFRFAEAENLYKTDPEFRETFDIIVDHSIRDRIIYQLSYANFENETSNDIISESDVE